MAVSQENYFDNVTLLVGVLLSFLFCMFLLNLEKKWNFWQVEFFISNGQFPRFLPHILARRMGPEGASHGLHLKLSNIVHVGNFVEAKVKPIVVQGRLILPVRSELRLCWQDGISRLWTKKQFLAWQVKGWSSWPAREEHSCNNCVSFQS